MDDDPAMRFRENVTEITAMLVTGLWLALLLSGVGGGLWLGVLIVGYVAVVPIVALLFGDEEDQREWWDWWHDDWETWLEGEEDDEDDERETPEPANTVEHGVGRQHSPRNNRDALETLRERYAAGELTDAQFERKLERLLETETLEDVERWKRAAREDREIEYDR